MVCALPLLDCMRTDMRRPCTSTPPSPPSVSPLWPTDDNNLNTEVFTDILRVYNDLLRCSHLLKKCYSREVRSHAARAVR